MSSAWKFFFQKQLFPVIRSGYDWIITVISLQHNKGEWDTNNGQQDEGQFFAKNPTAVQHFVAERRTRSGFPLASTKRELTRQPSESRLWHSTTWSSRLKFRLDLTNVSVEK